jgi:hypothetical protein
MVNTIFRLNAKNPRSRSRVDIGKFFNKQAASADLISYLPVSTVMVCITRCKACMILSHAPLQFVA